MTSTHRSNASSGLRIAGRYFRGWESLGKTPSRPAFIVAQRPSDFPTWEDALAWTSIAIIRRTSYLIFRNSHLYGGSRPFGALNLDEIMKLPVAAWVLPRSRDGQGAVDDWFDGEPPDTNFRLLLVHRSQAYDNTGLPRMTHQVLQDKGLVSSRRKGSYVHLKRIAEPLLDSLLDAYSKAGTTAVTDLLGSQGYEPGFSDFCPELPDH